LEKREYRTRNKESWRRENIEQGARKVGEERISNKEQVFAFLIFTFDLL